MTLRSRITELYRHGRAIVDCHRMALCWRRHCRAGTASMLLMSSMAAQAQLNCDHLTVVMPAPLAAATASMASARGGSAMPINPSSVARRSVPAGH